MKFGELASRCEVPAKTIRYYESIGLLPPAARTESGYRQYGDADVRILEFIHRARSLGFGTGDLRDLLDLWHDRGRASADVRAVASRQIEAVSRKIAELESIRGALVHLIDACHGDERPDCPILDTLAGKAVQESAAQPSHEPT